MKESKSTTPVVAFIMALLIGVPVCAQVTIGASIEPNKGAFLDLKQWEPDTDNTTSDKGLLLPRVQLTNLTKLYPMFTGNYGDEENAKHVGLTVYHAGCNPLIPWGIYVWDGTKWNGINVNQPAPAPSGAVDIVVKVDANGNGTSDSNTPCRKVLRFLTYNLGATADIAGSNATPGETAKAQMGYTSGGATDNTVFGDMYQWGRQRDGHEKRNSGTTTTRPADPANAGSQFVTGSSDWLSTQTDNLWGNGLAIGSGGNGVDSEGNEVPLGKGSYDPCPSGYRVPTQHEWALLGNEGGNYGDTSNDSFSTTSNTNSTVAGNAATPTGNPGITWVRVSGGKASSGFVSNATCGYALYDFDEWKEADTGYKNGSDLLSDAGAPEPLLFLPAGGYRYYGDGYVYNTGSYGYYWSSVVNGADSHNMYFYSSSVNANSGSNRYRAYGLSVRCVAE